MLSLSDGLAVQYTIEDLCDRLNTDEFGYRPMSIEEICGMMAANGNRFKEQICHTVDGRDDDNQSDVYVIFAVDFSFHIMIAEQKQRKNIDVDFSKLSVEEMLDRHNEFYIPTDPRFAGKLFKCSTHHKCIEKLLYLRNAGLHVPDHAFQRLRKELMTKRIRLLRIRKVFQ